MASPPPASAPAASAPACGKPPCPPPVKKKVIRLDAKVPGTRGVRDPRKKRRANTLKSSSSKEESLTKNKPVVLIRGCNEVELKATTRPANQPVKWEVKPNENSESPPTITPTDGGKKATLKTDKTGSFSVIATLDDTKVVWNVVFAWVKVKVNTSVIHGRNTNYADDGFADGENSFRSGKFVGSHKNWYAMDAQVDVDIIGGGTAGTLGIEKVRLHTLQNGTADTLTGVYDWGDTALEVPRGGLPILDSISKSSPVDTYDPNQVTIRPNNRTASHRTVWIGDSPTGAFRRRHRTNPSHLLRSITGTTTFVSAIASTTTHAPRSFNVQAKFEWTADFSGTIDYGTPPKAVGKYRPNTVVDRDFASALGLPPVSPAGTTVDPKYQLISEGTGGQDAHDAGFETFGPLFNDGTDTRWTP